MVPYVRESRLWPGGHTLLKSCTREHAHTSIHDEFVASGKRLFERSCCPEYICGLVLAYRCSRRRRAEGPHHGRGRNIIFVTCHQKRGRRPARTRNVNHRAVLPRISPPGWKARRPTVARSRACPYQLLRRVWPERQTLFRMTLLSGVHFRGTTCVSL